MTRFTVACVVAWACLAGSANAQSFTYAQLAAAEARYAYEPSVALVVQAARRPLSAVTDRVRSRASHARMSGWVPSLRLGVRRGLGRDLSALQDENTDRTNLSTDDDLALEASLTFRLDRLVFAREEVALLREERDALEENQERVQSVIRLYYERRRLQLERDLLGHQDVQRAMRILEIEAVLDVLTDGAFGRMLRHARLRRQTRAPLP